jgi:hypothetical protein
MAAVIAMDAFSRLAASLGSSYISVKTEITDDTVAQEQRMGALAV